MQYAGGKGGDGVYQRIIGQIPPHETWIVPFLGADAITRHKKPARLSIGVDTNPECVSRFAEWVRAKEPAWLSAQLSDSGNAAWQRSWERLTSMSMAGPPVFQLVLGDGVEFLRYFPWRDHPNAFVYCDPPYLYESRTSKKRIYKQHDWAEGETLEERIEFSRRRHEALLTLLKEPPAKVAISGYWNDLYADLLKGWRHVSYTACLRSHATPRKEFLWMNYPQPEELHDPRFAGVNRSERQRMKKKQNRWKTKLLNMSKLERDALMAAIREIE